MVSSRVCLLRILQNLLNERFEIALVDPKFAEVDRPSYCFLAQLATM